MAHERGEQVGEAAAVAGGGERPGTFDRALGKTLPILRGRALMMIGDAMAADDLVQDALERALRARLRPPTHELQPWLLRILKNLVIDRWRVRAGQRTCELRDEHDDRQEEPVFEPWWIDVTRPDIDAALEALPDTFRRLLQLQIEGYSYGEMAVLLELKRATVGTRLFRGRQLLRRALEERCQQRVDRA